MRVILESRLAWLAYLIDAGISAPVLKLKIGSFDTHENQTWRHRRLLQDLSKGLSGLTPRVENKVGIGTIR